MTPMGGAGNAEDHLQPYAAEAQKVPPTPDSTRTILHGYGLALARFGWVAFTAVALYLCVTMIPMRYDELTTVCDNPPCGALQLSSAEAARLDQWGLSLAGYAWAGLAVDMTMSLMCFGLGVLLFWRRSNDGAALLFTVHTMAFGVTSPSPIAALITEQPMWSAPMLFMATLSAAAGLVWYHLYPDGRFISRAMQAVAAVTVLCLGLGLFVPGLPLNPYIGVRPWSVGLVFGFITVGLVSLIVRYGKTRSQTDRRFLRMVALANTFGMVMSLATYSLTVIFPALSSPGVPRLIFNVVGIPCLVTIPGIAVCMLMGMAVFRYHVFGAEIVVTRAFLFGWVTAVMIGLTTGVIDMAQRVSMALTGDRSYLAVVATTVVVVALLTPIRTRMESFIRRHFGDVPNAAKTLERVSKQLREEAAQPEPKRIGQRLLDETALAFEAENGAIAVREKSVMRVMHVRGEWNGVAEVVDPIEREGRQFGYLMLGQRRNGLGYDSEDVRSLRAIVGVVANTTPLVPMPGA